MDDCYENSEEHDFSDLDEWLCEYVDGTIDPIVREALEEYMQINPVLASHVESLRETRYLLCRYGCNHKAPRELQPRLRNRLEHEIIHDSEPLFSKYNVHLATLAALSSFAALILLLASATQQAHSPLAPPFSMFSATQSQPEAPSSQEPVLQATPSDVLNNYPIYSRFTNNKTPLLFDAHMSNSNLSPTPFQQSLDTLSFLNSVSSQSFAP